MGGATGAGLGQRLYHDTLPRVVDFCILPFLEVCLSLLPPLTNFNHSPNHSLTKSVMRAAHIIAAYTQSQNSTLEPYNVVMGIGLYPSLSFVFGNDALYRVSATTTPPTRPPQSPTATTNRCAKSSVAMDCAQHFEISTSWSHEPYRALPPR